MKKRKWNRVLSIFLVMVTVISLMSGCDRKSAKNEEKDTITVYLWSTNLYENMPHTFRNSFQILILNL